jgi:hypothetical protein
MIGSAVAVERTPDGRRLVVSRAIDAPADVVWTLLTDTRWWPVWGPSVGAVEVDGDDRTIREGTTGRVRVAGTLVPFRIDRCRDRRWTWRVADVPATGHRVEAVDGRSRAAFEVPLLAAPYAVVCARALRTIARLAERGITEPSSDYIG